MPLMRGIRQGWWSSTVQGRKRGSPAARPASPRGPPDARSVVANVDRVVAEAQEEVLRLVVQEGQPADVGSVLLVGAGVDVDVRVDLAAVDSELEAGHRDLPTLARRCCD